MSGRYPGHVQENPSNKPGEILEVSGDVPREFKKNPYVGLSLHLFATLSVSRSASDARYVAAGTKNSSMYRWP